MTTPRFHVPTVDIAPYVSGPSSAAARTRVALEIGQGIAPTDIDGLASAIEDFLALAPDVNERAVPLEAQRRMQELTPGSRVVTLHTGHAPQVSAPGLLSAAIADLVTPGVASLAGPDALLAATATADSDLLLAQTGGAS